MTYIHFIINPISGSGKHNLSASYFLQHFPASEYKIEVDIVLKTLWVLEKLTYEKLQAYQYPIDHSILFK